MEQSVSMEQTINDLLEADAQAQEKLLENQQRRQQMADQMARVKETMQKEGYDRAQAQIDAARAQAQKAFEEETHTLRASYDAALGELKSTYESRREEWIKSIVARCLR